MKQQVKNVEGKISYGFDFESGKQIGFQDEGSHLSIQKIQGKQNEYSFHINTTLISLNDEKLSC